MESIVEELQLLGISDPDKKDSSLLGNVEIIKSLLNLYYKTFEEKKELEELCLSLNSDITKLRGNEAKSSKMIASQEVWISNNKRKQKILEEELSNAKGLLQITKKEAEKEKLKWERWAQLQRMASNKALHQLSEVKEELRKKIGFSSNAHKPSFPIQHRQITMSRSLPMSTNNQLLSKSSSCCILEKALQRLDIAHRILVKEGAEVCSSLQLIDTSLQDSVNALRKHIDVELSGDISSESINKESPHSSSQWIPLILDRIHQNCLKLSEIVSYVES